MDNEPAIIFDFDGTLADSFLAAINIFHKLNRHGRQRGDEDISRLRGMSMVQIAREFKVPLWRMPLLPSQIRHMMNDQIAEIVIIQGIDEAIRTLSKMHKLFILSSNSTANVRAFLQHFGIEECFSDIYGNAGLFNKASKLQKLVRNNGLAAATTWYVGDEVRDIKAAHKAGLKSVAVAWGYNNIHLLKIHKPDALVFDVDELVRCFAHN